MIVCYTYDKQMNDYIFEKKFVAFIFMTKNHIYHIPKNKIVEGYILNDTIGCNETIHRHRLEIWVKQVFFIIEVTDY